MERFLKSVFLNIFWKFSNMAWISLSVQQSLKKKCMLEIIMYTRFLVIGTIAEVIHVHLNDIPISEIAFVHIFLINMCTILFVE